MLLQSITYIRFNRSLGGYVAKPHSVQILKSRFCRPQLGTFPFSFPIRRAPWTPFGVLCMHNGVFCIAKHSANS